MNRFLAALLALALTVGAGWAETTPGTLYFSSLDHTSQKTTKDTLLGGASDTTNAVTITDARRLGFYLHVDKLVSTGSVTATHQIAPNDDDFATVFSTAYSTTSGTGTKAYVLLNEVVPDSSLFGTVAGAKKWRVILTKTNGASADSAMLRASTFITRD